MGDALRPALSPYGPNPLRGFVATRVDRYRGQSSVIHAWLSMYRERDRRVGLIGEAQWRILLDLAGNGDCSITSACIASGAPATTGLRHIAELEKRGLITRRDDPLDGRRHWLALTDVGRALFTPALAEAA